MPDDADLMTVREAAAHAVGQMGPEALPALREMLDHDDKYVRRNAVWAMGKLGPLSKGEIDKCAAHSLNPRTISRGQAGSGMRGPSSATPTTSQEVATWHANPQGKSSNANGRPAAGTRCASTPTASAAT